MVDMEHHDESPHLIPYRVYFVVWIVLLVLTALTVSVSMIDLRNVTVLAALLIASGKALLVLLYFMHIRYEKYIYVVMICAALFTYVAFIGLTFTDYWYR